MSAEPGLHAATGAFGYTGKYIARRLLAGGKRVCTLTAHPNRPNPFGNALKVRPLPLEDADALREALNGVAVLYNTYWVRFAYGGVTYAKAVEYSQRLFTAAREAGVQRIVHISITNPSADSPFPYFRGKAAVEQALRESGVSYAILRPTVIFGPEDILINNIAWLLRRFPLFTLAGSGNYRMQPVFAEDVAKLAVEHGDRRENAIFDAVGPETYTFKELVGKVRSAVGSHAAVLHVPGGLQLFCARLLGVFLRDVLLTRDELGGLMADLLVSQQPATCPTRFSEWLQGSAVNLGRQYSSELQRHYAARNGKG